MRSSNSFEKLLAFKHKQDSVFFFFFAPRGCFVNSFWLSSWEVGFFDGSDDKESACNAGNLSSVLATGRCPGEGNGKPLQYSCLENSMHRGAWRATVHGVAKGWTRLSHSHIYNIQLATTGVTEGEARMGRRYI